MKSKTVLTTPRLILRTFTPNDAQRWIEISKNRNVMQWVGGVQTSEQALAYLEHLIGLYEEQGGYGLYAVEHTQDKKLIGFCGIKKQEVHGEKMPELGYRLDDAYWGQGLATEAAQSVKKYAQETLKLSTLISLILPTNSASRRVAEKVGGAVDGDVERFGRTVLIYRYW